MNQLHFVTNHGLLHRTTYPYRLSVVFGSFEFHIAPLSHSLYNHQPFHAHKLIVDGRRATWLRYPLPCKKPACTGCTLLCPKQDLPGEDEPPSRQNLDRACPDWIYHSPPPPPTSCYCRSCAVCKKFSLYIFSKITPYHKHSRTLAQHSE